MTGSGERLQLMILHIEGGKVGEGEGQVRDGRRPAQEASHRNLKFCRPP